MERWHKVVLLTAFYCSYLLVGSLIFQALEEGEEENLRTRIRRELRQFLVNNTCVNGRELRGLVNEVVHAYSNGLRFEESNITSFGKRLWDFSNSLFFATTVITTIGYGNMTPSTTKGKLFCMLFALVGIPLTGIFATVMGNQLENHWKGIINKVNKSISCIKNDKIRKSVLTLLLAIGLYLLVVCVPAAIVNEIEGWGYFLSHYYALISISTIGFGDYVAGNGSEMSEQVRAIYKLALVIYFVFGFVILTIIFKTSQQINDKQVRKVRRFTSTVKGRLRRASMFPSQSSGVCNGNVGTERQFHKQPVHTRRKRSPTCLTIGHKKRKFNFGLACKSIRKRPLSSQECHLNISNSTASSKDLSTVKDDVSDDVFISQDRTSVYSPRLVVPTKSLHDIRHVRETNFDIGVSSISGYLRCHSACPSDICKTI